MKGYINFILLILLNKFDDMYLNKMKKKKDDK